MTRPSIHRAFLLLGLVAVMQAAVLRAAGPRPMSQDVPPGTNLDDLASRYLGNSRYAISIALATNARTADGFRYIGNPDDLTGIQRVCVPSKSEARQLERSWAAYDRAVSVARLPRKSALSTTLVTIPADQPVTVVAWVRKDQADRMKSASGDWIKTAASDTWVTVEPHLQEFCRALALNQKSDDAKLTARLEQRLGLSPSSSKTTFVRMRLDHPGSDVVFRPCSDPAADRAGCVTGPPANSPAGYKDFFLGQYYSSYGQSLIGEFPWTALGYTFDWAPAPGRTPPFVRFGESEFVIRKDSPISIVDAVPTSTYCAAPH